MTVLSSIGATLTVSGTPEPSVRAVLTVSPDPLVPEGESVTADINYDDALVAAAFPGTRHQLLVGLRVYVDGDLVDPAYFLPGARVTRALGERATFSLPLATHSDWPARFGYPVGRPEAYLGPPPGGADITIDGVYATASGFRAVRLITGGVVENCEETFAELDTHQLNGLGPAGRVDGRTINFNLPAGHGLSRAAVAGRIATALGVEDFAFSAAGRMDKLVQIVDANGLQLLRDVLLPAGRTPAWDPSGLLHDPVRVRRDSGFDIVLNEEDLLVAGGLRRASAKEGPTGIVVEGEAQVVREGCERVTTIRFNEAIALYKRHEAAFQQQSNGTLAALTPTQFPEIQPVERVTTIEERECDRLISTRVISQEMRNASAWRYEQDVNGNHQAWSTYYIFDSGAEADDGALAFRHRVERFETVGDAITTPIYDDDGFEVGATVISRGWHQRRAPIKEQTDPPSPWEEIDYIAGQQILGNGEAVDDPIEVYYGTYHTVTRNGATNWLPRISHGISRAIEPGVFPVGTARVRRTVDIEHQLDAAGVIRGGSIRRETDAREEWSARKGSGDYLYGDGEEYRDSGESFRLVRIDSTEYVPEQGDGSHTSFQRARDGEGRGIDGEPDRIASGQQGYLPAAERSIDLDPDTGLYPDGKVASAREAQPIQCDYRVPVPSSIRGPRTERIHNPWIETEAEACALARDTMSLRWALRVTATMPIAFTLREGMRVLINLSRADLHLAVHVKSVEHNIPGPLEYATTVLQGDAYVV